MSSRSHSAPLVVLVGRPNVGKSTLYNRLVGRRQAIVADVAGTTRDRLQTTLEWNDKRFELADLAGIERPTLKDNELEVATQAQVDHSLQTSTAIIWVVDSRVGLTPADRVIGDRLRKTGKPVIVAVNKCDHPQHDQAEHEFSAYRFRGLVPISGLNGRGIDELLQAVSNFIPEHDSQVWQDDRQLRLSIVGRPNVGKSTLLNAITGEERMVVSNVPGTTRDAIDTIIPAEQLFDNTFTRWQSVRVVDTAGIRRRGKIGLGLEKWSLVRTLDAVDQSDVVLFVIDANEGMVHQDMQIAQEIVKAGRPLVLLVNKWDQVLDMKKAFPATEEDMKAQEIFLVHLRQVAKFLYWVPVLFLSAKDRLNTYVIGRLVLEAYNAWSVQIDPEDLAELTKQLQASPRLKNLQKITLEHSQPPVFHVHVEGRNLPHFSTIRMIENTLRDTFNLGPTPIKIWSVTSIAKGRRKPYKN